MEEFDNEPIGDAFDGDPGTESGYSATILSFGNSERRGTGNKRRSTGNRRGSTESGRIEESTVKATVAPQAVKRGRAAKKLTQGQMAGAGMIHLVSQGVALNYGELWELLPPECESIAVAATPLASRLPIPDGHGSVVTEALWLAAALCAPILTRLFAMMKMNKMKEQMQQSNGAQNAPSSYNGASSSVLFRQNGIGEEYNREAPFETIS